jgi:2-oxoisovalerate dehydrogenase E1 component
MCPLEFAADYSIGPGDIISLVMKASTLAPSTGSPTADTAARDHDLEGLTHEDLLRAYRIMLLSRRLDDKEIQLKNQSQIFFQISGAGHEAVLTAAGLHLRPGYDWFYPYYRDRALCLTLGVTPLEMLLAAVGAKDDPANGGRQMPSHWGHRAYNIPSQGSPTGTQCLQAVGAGEAGMIYAAVPEIPDRESRFHGDEITYVSVGEGATSEGEFWESLNTACTRSVPMLYLVEDNGYAISVPVEVQTPGGDVSRLVESFPNLRVWRCDGTDFLASYRTLGEAAAYIRRERKPAFVHARVIRPYSHSLSDDERLYKPPAEREAEARRDPLTRMRAFLVAQQIAGEEDLQALAAAVDAEIAEATSAALVAPKPGVETADWYVFSPDVDPASAAFETPEAPAGKPDTMVAAINRTLKDEMAVNPRLVVFGEDVADASREAVLPQVPGKGGVFKVTHGLQKAYGPVRVFNSPLAEANIVGRAVGMATRGLKPVVEIQFFDYIWPAMMQLRDEMSMLRYRSSNNWKCPMVVRVPIGGYLRGGAPYHSQSGVSIFAHCPGIRIAMPSNAADAAGLLRTAIRCDDPVMFLEHKHLYRQTYNKGVYPGANYMIPFGRGSLRREGTDVVVLTWGALVQRSLLAAQQAEKDGVSAAVFDLRTIVPYDWEGLAALVRRTNRVIVAHEDQLTCGFGAEIAARIGDELFAELDAPVRRVAAMDCPVAYCPDLEEVILPQSSDILAAIKDLAAY